MITIRSILLGFKNITKYTPLSTFIKALPHKLVLFIDENGKSQGRQYLDTIKYDTNKYDLAMVKDDSALPVYRLQPRGLAYHKAREQHAKSLLAKRAAKIKQVRFRTAMAPHDFATHVQRVKRFVEEEGVRVRCVVEAGVQTRASGRLEAPMRFAQRVLEATTGWAVMETPPEQLTEKSVAFSLKPSKQKEE